MDKIKDTYNDVIKSWRRRSIGLSLYIKLNINSSFEGAFDADSHSIGNPTEFVVLEESYKFLVTIHDMK